MRLPNDGEKAGVSGETDNRCTEECTKSFAASMAQIVLSSFFLPSLRDRGGNFQSFYAATLRDDFRQDHPLFTKFIIIFEWAACQVPPAAYMAAGLLALYLTVS